MVSWMISDQRNKYTLKVQRLLFDCFTGKQTMLFSWFRNQECPCNFIATLARRWTTANVCSFMAKVVWCSSLSGSELEQATWFLLAGSNSTIRNKTLFPTQGLRCLADFSFLGFQLWEGDTLHWSDPVRKWKLWREWFSHGDHLSRWSLLDRCMCARCSKRWLIGTGLLHQCFFWLPGYRNPKSLNRRKLRKSAKGIESPKPNKKWTLAWSFKRIRHEDETRTLDSQAKSL